MAGQEHLLRKGQRLTFPPGTLDPVLVFVGSSATRYRFQGRLRSPQSDKCVVYEKCSGLTLELLQGEALVTFDVED